VNHPGGVMREGSGPCHGERGAVMFSRRKDPQLLRVRCRALAAVVERRVAAHAEAVARYLEESGSREAREQLDAAEERLYLAEWELRRARRALRRAEIWRLGLHRPRSVR
jgi:hypothetical protein